MPCTTSSNQRNQRVDEAHKPLTKSLSDPSTALSTVAPTASNASLSSSGSEKSSDSVFSNGNSNLSFFSNRSEVSASSSFDKKAKSKRVRFMDAFSKCIPESASMCLTGAKSKKSRRTKPKVEITNTMALLKERREAEEENVGYSVPQNEAKGRWSFDGRESYCSFVNPNVYDAEGNLKSLNSRTTIPGTDCEIDDLESNLFLDPASRLEEETSSGEEESDETPALSKEASKATTIGSYVNDCFPRVAKDSNCAEQKHTYTEASTPWKIRGPNYLKDRKKIDAGDAKMELVCADVFSTEKSVRNYAEWKNGAIQKLREQGDERFFLCVNWMCGPEALAIVFAFPEGTDEKSGGKMITKFVNEMSDEERNKRWKVIPCCIDGPWLVKKAVGTVPAIIGTKLTTTYVQGKDYLEIVCDVFSSYAARQILGVIKGASKKVCIDLAFVVEAQEEAELPEEVVGQFTIFRPDMSKFERREN